MDIPVELSRLIINETSEEQIIVLKERAGRRTLPIVIGIVEIFAIDRRLKGIKPPRPMTHDLLAAVLEKAGVKVDKIVIKDLHNHIFYAGLFLSIDGRVIEVDARPSDAIALSVASGAPIFVAEEVFEKAQS
ncbi:MAG: bifunctional nuclease family protein [Planctomycetota bacterium]